MHSCALLVGLLIGTATLGTVCNFFKKLEIVLTYDTVIPLLRIYSKVTKALTWKDFCIPIFLAALFTIVKRN